MGLEITDLSYRDFRSYERMQLSDLGGLTLFIGPNAAGKTNLLEGIQLITALSSFRMPRTDHLIRQGCSSCSVSAHISDGYRELDVEFQAAEGRRTYLLNGKRRQAGALRGLLPAVSFIPDDLNLAKGSDGVRRDALDALGCQLSSGYHAVFSDYQKILRQKNRYLKEAVDHAFLVSIDDVMARIGAQLYALRMQLLDQLVPYIKDAYAELSGDAEGFGIAYTPSWVKFSPDQANQAGVRFSREQAEEALIDAMERFSSKEQDRRRSLYGPHADHIEFRLAGRDARVFASQGQQRSLVLAVKMAEVALIRDRLGQSPVLLLDDVMSELDERRRSRLLELIASDIQTFVTATTLSYFPESTLGRARVVRVGEN